jgi:hypothetical protein
MLKNHRIIILAGKKRSGKSTAAEIIKNEIDDEYKIVNIGDNVKNVTCDLINTLLNQNLDVKTIESWDRDTDGFNVKGVNGKTKLTIRKLYQKIGTDIIRKYLGPNIWVETLCRSMNKNGKYIVADCRFSNEAKFIRNYFGQDNVVIYKIFRNTENHDAHISENDLINIKEDKIILNTGNIQSFKKILKKILSNF